MDKHDCLHHEAHVCRVNMAVKNSLSSSECPSVHRGHITWKRGKMLLLGHSFIIDHFGEHLEVNMSQQTFVAKETQVTTVKSSQANILGSS